MSEHQSPNRRQFLKALSCLLYSSAWGSLYELGLDATQRQRAIAGTVVPHDDRVINTDAGYKIAPWTGDDFTFGHRLRDDDIPKLTIDSERSVDFAIVGGGMAGLTSAYYLRNHNFLLLEQYDELGGQSRGRFYRGIDYSLGAAYMGTNEGIYGDLFADLGITPVALSPAKNSWYWDGTWLPGVKGKEQVKLYQEFKRFIAECKPIWKIKPEGEPRLPLAGDDLTRLDGTLFSSYLKGYDPQFIALMDSFCKSSSCAGVGQLSALAGFYLAEDLVSPSYIFKGGNPAIAKALRAKLENTGKRRCLTGAFVWRIEIKDGGASIVYSSKDGGMHRVNCRRAIIAVPPLVAVRIIPQLDDKTKSELLWFKFGSYLVANFCLGKKVFDGAYDNWLGSQFTFSDFILAETPYQASGSYKEDMGQVLTVYQPYSNISAGRTLLLAGNRQDFASSLVDQLSRLAYELRENLEEVVLTRWGHAMAIARPNLFAKLSQCQALDTGCVKLAHSSMLGLPSAESAITGAHIAAHWALDSKPKRTSKTVGVLNYDPLCSAGA